MAKVKSKTKTKTSSSKAKPSDLGRGMAAKTAKAIVKRKKMLEQY